MKFEYYQTPCIPIIPVPGTTGIPMVLVHGTGIIGIHGVWSHKYLTRFLKSTLKILVNPGDAKTHMSAPRSHSCFVVYSVLNVFNERYTSKTLHFSDFEP